MELDDLVTKDFVCTEVAELRVEMHQLVNRLFVSLAGVTVGVAGLALAIARIG